MSSRRSTTPRRFPFPIRGIDSDNGSEFINAHLLDYCTNQHITFTRSRPGNKNDGAHVEQKNWTHVRELVGYLRFDTPPSSTSSTTSGSSTRGFTNHLLTQQKLVREHRLGAKVIKRHDRAQTPHDRALAHQTLRDVAHHRTRPSPGALQHEIQAL